MTNVESAHWALKRLLQNSLGDLCSVWDAMNNMIMLQHTKIKASFETSTHVVGHVFKVTLYKRLLGMVSRYVVNQIVVEYKRVYYVGKNPSCCGCVMRTTHDLPCACELSKYSLGTIPLETIHMFWRRLSFSDQGLNEPQVTLTKEMEIISNKVTLKSKLWEISYPGLNSMCPPPEKVNTKGAQKKPMTKHQRSTKRDPSYWECVDPLHFEQNSNSSVKRSASSSDHAIPRRTMPMLDQFHLFVHDSIENIMDLKADGNCGYHAIVALLGMGEDSWSLVCNHLLKELTKWSDEYINLFCGIDRFEELKSLNKCHPYIWFIQVTMDKWIDIIDMGYVIASRYNVILVSLSLQQSMTFFPLRSQPPTNSFVHHIICIGHVFGNHFVQVYLRVCCPLLPLALLWSRNCHPQAKQWPTSYISRMHQYRNLMMLKKDYVDLSEE
ncbi:hypothetical protein HKD37_17G048373 [Glycine soja]